MRVLLEVCCIFSEQLLLRTSLDWRAASGQRIVTGLNNWLYFVDYNLIPKPQEFSECVFTHQKQLLYYWIKIKTKTNRSPWAACQKIKKHISNVSFLWEENGKVSPDHANSVIFKRAEKYCWSHYSFHICSN